MKSSLWGLLILVLGLSSSALSYGHGYYHHGYWGGRNVIIVNPYTPVGGYYRDYNYYYPNYYNYNPYYYPRYRCITVPRCYPSGSCNYEYQCGYY